MSEEEKKAKTRRFMEEVFNKGNLTVIDELLADGDKVVIRSSMTGTNKGALMGTPATVKQIEVAGIDIVRITGGKAVEHWGITQDLEIMQQLGLVPKI